MAPSLGRPGHSDGSVTAAAEIAAARIDSEPGIPDADLRLGIDPADSPTRQPPSELVRRELLQRGYRRFFRKEMDNRGIRNALGMHSRGWPSRARCAELARSATGDRRERLLQGVLA